VPPGLGGQGPAVIGVLFYFRRNLARAAVAVLFGIFLLAVSRTVAVLDEPVWVALGEHHGMGHGCRVGADTESSVVWMFERIAG